MVATRAAAGAGSLSRRAARVGPRAAAAAQRNQGGRLIRRLQAELARARALVERFPALRRFGRALLLLAHGFRGEAITLRASALTYLTLLSLVPLLAVVYSVVDLASGQENVRASVQRYVNGQLGIGAGQAVAAQLDLLTSKASIQALGVIGFAALLLSVTALLWNIEGAFNHIFAVKRQRRLLQRLLTYWVFLTLGPLVLAASVTISWNIGRMQVSHAQRAMHGHSELLHAVAALSSIAITYASLAFLYKVLPNARVRLRAALMASLTAGTVWELAKFAFAWASTRMVQVHKIYGSLAVLPIVLTWIYISWLVALAGCRLCYALEASRRPQPHPALEGVRARETFVARTMLSVARLHREGQRPVRVRRLMAELSAPRRMVREALRALVQAGLVAETRRGMVLPARDLARIDFGQIRAAARAAVRFPPRDPDPLDLALSELWDRADSAANGALEESLARFLERAGAPGRASPEPPAQGVLAPLPGPRAQRQRPF